MQHFTTKLIHAHNNWALFHLVWHENLTRSVVWFLVKLFRNSKQKWHSTETNRVPSGQAWYSTLQCCTCAAKQNSAMSIFVLISSHSLTRFMRMVWSIGNYWFYCIYWPNKCNVDENRGFFSDSLEVNNLNGSLYCCIRSIWRVLLGVHILYYSFFAMVG